MFRTLKPYHKAKTKAKPSFKVAEYNKTAWRKYSIDLRTASPTCAHSKREYLLKYLVVDHIIPVNEGGSFWDVRNHQVLSIWSHNKKTQKERSGCKTAFVLNENGEKIPEI